MEEKKRSRGKRSVGSAEVYFAKKLANNDKKVRDRAVKRLKVWLSSRSRSNSGMCKLLPVTDREQRPRGRVSAGWVWDWGILSVCTISDTLTFLTCLPSTDELFNYSPVLHSVV